MLLILGRGPAGISAALYAVRAGIETVVIGMDGGALKKTDKIDNYYGLSEAVSGAELLARGEAQAKRLGVRLVEAQAVGIGLGDASGFRLQTTAGDFDGDALVMATGSARKTPSIPGLAALEGAGVSYCAVCDGFFYRGKQVAVLGAGEYALRECAELLPLASSVTLLTDGNPPATAIDPRLRVITTPVAEIKGAGKVESVLLQDGKTLPVDGVFVAVGVASTTDFARKIGCVTEGGKIAVNAQMATNIPGLFAAGDCTGGLLQVAKAVGDGAVAGTSAVKYIRGLQK